VKRYRVPFVLWCKCALARRTPIVIVISAAGGVTDSEKSAFATVSNAKCAGEIDQAVSGEIFGKALITKTCTSYFETKTCIEVDNPNVIWIARTKNRRR
jgi:hypothetical protein